MLSSNKLLYFRLETTEEFWIYLNDAFGPHHHIGRLCFSHIGRRWFFDVDCELLTEFEEEHLSAIVEKLKELNDPLR